MLLITKASPNQKRGGKAAAEMASAPEAAATEGERGSAAEAVRAAGRTTVEKATTIRVH